MAAIHTFRDLQVYQTALEGARTIFVVSQEFPREEKYSLTDQVRRSSRAVSALIAEGWARRRYPAAFVNKLNEAMGEATETQCWLDHALACDYITPNQHRDLDLTWQRIGAMLQNTIRRANDFCRSAS
jgi:four helix bundle protein